MKIERHIIQSGQFQIPTIVIHPDDPIGASVVVHGYGGCKEEQLGLAWRVAELGLASIVIDLRGHGEHGTPMDENPAFDVEAAIKLGKRFGKVTAIGHSLGGRLALLSGADFAVAVSPALSQEFSETTRKVLENMRSHRVRESFPGVNFEVLRKLPVWQPEPNREALILYGSRDVPEIMNDCQELLTKGIHVEAIDDALHGDTFLLEAAYTQIIGQLKKWYSENPAV